MPALESFHLINIISGNKEDCPGIEFDGPRVWMWWREILSLTEVEQVNEVTPLWLVFDTLEMVLGPI